MEAVRRHRDGSIRSHLYRRLARQGNCAHTGVLRSGLTPKVGVASRSATGPQHSLGQDAMIEEGREFTLQVEETIRTLLRIELRAGEDDAVGQITREVAQGMYELLEAVAGGRKPA